MSQNKQILNYQDIEKEHFPCTKEWWCAEGFFTTAENNKKWSFKASLYQGILKSKFIVSAYTITIFDLNNKKIYNYHSENDSCKLESEKDRFYIKYDKSYIKGSFPNYQMHFNDLKNNINLNLKLNSKTTPYWIAQQVTDGWLPWGLGYYRYGFIPANNIEGTIKINNKNFSIKGKGYFEHIWGDFSFLNLKKLKRSIKKTLSTYSKLISWWFHNQEIKIPKSIRFSTDNRPFGYDWFWTVLDNDWSIFYGNIIFWLLEGPATGILILKKNENDYIEFGNINFKYNKMKYLSQYDFYYPIELEIVAVKGNKKLYLNFKNISECFEDFYETTDKKIFLGFLISQVPCEIDGYYFDGKEKIFINGLSKMEFHRLLSVFGHNTLNFDIDISSKSFGIKSNFNSHLLEKNFDIHLQFLPKPKLKIKFNKINKKDLMIS